MAVRAICNGCGKVAVADVMVEAEKLINHKDICPKKTAPVAKPAPKVVEATMETPEVEKPKATKKPKSSED